MGVEVPEFSSNSTNSRQNAAHFRSGEVAEAIRIRDRAIEFLRSAAPVALDHFRAPLDVDHKADQSPVTRADRATEQAIRARIAAEFPDDGIFGEEFGRAEGESAALWIIDPIDGTRSFISGHPLFGMLLARMVAGVVQASAVALPAVNEFYAAARGGGAVLNGQPIAVSGCTDPLAATIYVNEGERLWRTEPELLSRVMQLGQNRRFSYDCAPYGLLASGHVDVVVDCGLEPYDYLPVSLLVEEAGGIITDWQGQPLTLESDGRVVAAATPALHAALLQQVFS